MVSGSCTITSGREVMSTNTLYSLIAFFTRSFRVRDLSRIEKYEHISLFALLDSCLALARSERFLFLLLLIPLLASAKPPRVTIIASLYNNDECIEQFMENL